MMNYNKLSADPAALILGIVSLVVIIVGCCCGLFAVIALGLSITGLVLANKSLKEYALAPENYSHKSRANVSTGKVLCIIGIVLSSIFVAISAVFFIYSGHELSQEFLEKYHNMKNHEVQYEINDNVDSVYTVESDTISIDTISIEPAKEN